MISLNRKIVPKIVGAIVILFILYAIASSFDRSSELKNYGVLTFAKLTSTEDGYRGKILYFELDHDGHVYKMNDLLGLNSNRLIDSFYRIGLPVIYSTKNPLTRQVLISKENFRSFNIKVPSQFDFLPD